MFSLYNLNRILRIRSVWWLFGYFYLVLKRIKKKLREPFLNDLWNGNKLLLIDGVLVLSMWMAKFSEFYGSIFLKKKFCGTHVGKDFSDRIVLRESFLILKFYSFALSFICVFIMSTKFDKSLLKLLLTI